MFADLPTIHVHASVCAKDFWFCVLMEAWARGKFPGKEGVCRKIDDAEHFINKLSNSSIKHFNLQCVPLKIDAPRDKPPRIALDEDGGAVWRYEANDLGNSPASKRRRPLSLEDENASGVAAPKGTSYSLMKMAAYVKAVTRIGMQVYHKCMRVENRKRKFDKTWELKAAEFEVEGAVVPHEGGERWRRRSVDMQWHMDMDEWQSDKRECQRRFEAWRAVMVSGSDALEAINNVKDEDNDAVGDDGDDTDEYAEDDDDDGGDSEGDDGEDGNGGDKNHDDSVDGEDGNAVTRYFLRPRVARLRRFATSDASGEDDDGGDAVEDHEERIGSIGCHDGCCHDSGGDARSGNERVYVYKK